MSRADEIAQGLREPSGCLTFPLDALEYSQGHEDYENGTPPPRMSSTSYDLGRNRAREKKEAQADVMDRIRRQQDEGRARVRALLADRPDLLAEYDARMAEIGRP